MGVEYKSVKVPINDFKEFEWIQPILGYRSFNEFVIEAVREHIRRKRIEAEMRLAKLKKLEEARVEFEY